MRCLRRGRHGRTRTGSGSARPGQPGSPPAWSTRRSSGPPSNVSSGFTRPRSRASPGRAPKRTGAAFSRTSAPKRSTRTASRSLQARAEAEQKLQAIRKKLEETRLQAEAVLPAQAAQQASAFAARGEAATIEENGKALADVLKLLTTAWVSAGTDAKDIFLIQNLEQILRTVVDRVKAVEVDETHRVPSVGVRSRGEACRRAATGDRHGQARRSGADRGTGSRPPKVRRATTAG